MSKVYSEILKKFNDYKGYQKKIAELEENIVWNNVNNEINIEAYYFYLANYPDGKYSDKAKQKIIEIKKVLAEIQKKREEERLAEIAQQKKEEARLAEIIRQKEEARLDEIRQKEEEEVRLAEIKRFHKIQSIKMGLLSLVGFGLFLFSIIYAFSPIIAIIVILGHLLILYIAYTNFIYGDELKIIYTLVGIIVIDFFIIGSPLPRISFGASLFFLFFAFAIGLG